MNVEGSVAVITGAGSGIGRALAEAFAVAGARVVIGDIDAASAVSTAARVTAKGLPAVSRQADAGNESDISALIALAADAFGPVDIYVANAGVIGPPGLGASEADWDHVLDVNVRAHIRAAKLLTPDWVARGRGHFVSTVSAAGLLTQIGAAAYSVSKHAAVGFAEWLAITYGDNGIGVTCVCPLGVDTPLLNSLRDSSDSTQAIARRAVTSSGTVLAPGVVADITVAAVRDNTFMVLPHPEVLDMYRRKGTDYDRWISGMRRYQRSLAEGAT